MRTPRELVRDYLASIEAAAAHLPADERNEVLRDLQAHLEEALSSNPTSAEIRLVIDRLGTASEIIGASSVGSPGAGGAVPSSVGARDVAALLLLVVGTLVLLPLLSVFALGAWVAGVLLLWMSPTWTTGEKALATLVWPGGLAFPLATGLVAARSCYSATSVTTVDGVMVSEATSQLACSGIALPLWLGLPVWLALIAAPIVVVVVLVRRARIRHPSG